MSEKKAELKKCAQQYKDEINIRVFEDLGIHQSDILSHYIILEAFNFFETLKHLKKYNKSLPNLPSYSDKLTKVRNKVVGHRDTNNEFPLAEDVINLLKELNNEATTEKIIEDIYDIFNVAKNSQI